jgi:hypothetical protein
MRSTGQARKGRISPAASIRFQALILALQMIGAEIYASAS